MKKIYAVSAVALVLSLFVGVATVAFAEETNTTAERSPVPQKFQTDARQRAEVEARQFNQERPPRKPIARPSDFREKPAEFQNNNRQDSDARSMSGQVGEERQNRDAFKERAENRMQHLKDRMGSTTGQNRAEERVKMAMKHMAELVLVHIDRMEKIIVRIESRATKLDELGGDTTLARADLESARAELSLAQADLATIQAGTMGIRSASNMAAVSEALSPIKGAIKSAHNHLKNARQFAGEAMKKLVEVKKTVRIDDSETH